MKICENCGMEYGDDNPFCPFCDERYGVVFVVNDVISADGLPPYKEEFPVIGETGVKQESFAANRDKIYKRNIRLAARENILPKMEVRAAYKPVVPLAEIGRDGAISPYKPPNPIVEKFNNIRKKIKAIKFSKTGKAVLGVLSVAAVFFTVIGFSWFETTDTYADYKFEKSQKEFEKRFVEQRSAYAKAIAEYHNTDSEYRCIYGKDNAVMHLIGNYTGDYDFAYINDTGKKLYLEDFSELFSGAEGMEDFKLMQIYYPSGAEGQIPIYNGVFDIKKEDFSLSIGLEYNEKNIKKSHLIKSGEAVTGYLVENEYLKGIPAEITIKSDSGLVMKLTNRIYQGEYYFYGYDYKFTNTTDHDIDKFYNEFIGEEYADKFYYLSWYDSNTSFSEYWEDGIPQSTSSFIVKPNETVEGFIMLDFRDKD